MAGDWSVRCGNGGVQRCCLCWFGLGPAISAPDLSSDGQFRGGDVTNLEKSTGWWYNSPAGPGDASAAAAYDFFPGAPCVLYSRLS
jgi:hypothetical protein